MVISILTLFPEMFNGPFSSSIVARAIKENKLEINLINIRDFASDKYRSVDDHPYGGGVGMIMRVDVIDKALTYTKNRLPNIESKSILLDPRGKTYDQKTAEKFSKFKHLILICGHYEGVDERVKKLVDGTISIGNYVLTGGEIPAMVISDSVARLLRGVLKKAEATKNESFSTGLLEYPQYTKPIIYKNLKVPEILLSGNHGAISEWRQSKSKELTLKVKRG